MPDKLVPEFIKQLRNRTPGWEQLIHADAEFSLLVFEGRTVIGRAAIARELNSWPGRLYKPAAFDVERLDDLTVLVRGSAQYSVPRSGLGAGRVWWLDEIRDGQVWRVRGFTNEQAARAAHKAPEASL